MTAPTDRAGVVALVDNRDHLAGASNKARRSATHEEGTTTATTERFDPEAELAARGVAITYGHPTCDGHPVIGLTSWKGETTVTVDQDLPPWQRRAVIGHELAHVERGPVYSDPIIGFLEDVEVDIVAARRLVRYNDLVRAMLDDDITSVTDLREALDVDKHLLRTYLAGLSDAQRCQLQTLRTVHLMTEEAFQ